MSLDIIAAATMFANTFGKEAASDLLGADMTLTVRNQNHATAIWLDAGEGHVKPGLQGWLETCCGGAKASGGSVSPVAASQRVTMQASNQPGWTGKVYEIPERDRTQYTVIRASGRRGQVTVVRANDDQKAALLALLGKDPVAQAAK